MQLRSVLLVLCLAVALPYFVSAAAQPTNTQFSCVFPFVSNNKVVTWRDSMLAAFSDASITNTSQVAAFWALGGVLTSNFETFKELGNSACQYYDGGCTYKGRGVFMMRGASLYRVAAQKLSFDYENSPDLVLEHLHAFKTAGWLWRRRDFDDFGTSWTLPQLASAATTLGLTTTVQQATVLALYVKSLACLSVDPVCSWYTVAQGDTPTTIAANNEVTVESLVALNNWSSSSQTLTVGETIKLYCV